MWIMVAIVALTQRAPIVNCIPLNNIEQTHFSFNILKIKTWIHENEWFSWTLTGFRWPRWLGENLASRKTCRNHWRHGENSKTEGISLKSVGLLLVYFYVHAEFKQKTFGKVYANAGEPNTENRAPHFLFWICIKVVFMRKIDEIKHAEKLKVCKVLKLDFFSCFSVFLGGQLQVDNHSNL